MHDDILYSVLIPAYNAEAYLEECLDSVLGQTHRNLQVVVIDDGSTDRTAEILDFYAAKDSRLEVVHRENRGVATTRLELFKMAKGKYINFVDADDTVEPEMAQVMIDVLESSGSDMAVCGMTNKMERSYMYSQVVDLKTEKISGSQARREFLEHRRLIGSLCTKVCRRELCSGVHCPPDIRYGEDAVMSWHILKHANSLVYVSAPLYHYRPNQDSVSRVSFGAAKMTGLTTWNYISAQVAESFPDLICLSKAQQCYQVGMLLNAMYYDEIDNSDWERTLIQVINQNIKPFKMCADLFAPSMHIIWVNMAAKYKRLGKLVIKMKKCLRVN